MCNGLDEALRSADPATSPGARLFDIIVIGGGTFGGGVAQHAFSRVVTAGTRPNPTLGIDPEQLGDDDSHHETVLSVTQPLDLSGACGRLRRLHQRANGSLADEVRLRPR